MFCRVVFWTIPTVRSIGLNISVPFSTFLAQNHQIPLYLFMRVHQVQSDGFWQAPDIYWSNMFDGTKAMTEREEMVFGLHRPTIRGYIHYIAHYTSEDNLIAKLYQTCGMDSDSDELASQFKLPLVEYLPCCRLQ